jgi:hypothetical protein
LPGEAQMPPGMPAWHARLRAALASAALVLSSAAAAAPPLVTPDWHFRPAHHAGHCVDASDKTHPENARWVYVGLPSGTPPPNGWPIYMSLITDPFDPPNKAAQCGMSGGGGGMGDGSRVAWADPNATMFMCTVPPPPPPPPPLPPPPPHVWPPGYWNCSSAVQRHCPFSPQGPCANCSASMPALAAAGCTAAMLPHICREDFMGCRMAMQKTCPAAVAAGNQSLCVACASENTDALEAANCTAEILRYACEPRGPGPGPDEQQCGYDQEAGSMWDSRASQFLVANGFAVVTVNPAEDDSWDAGPWYDWWQGGPDHKFLPKLVDELNSGA